MVSVSKWMLVLKRVPVRVCVLVSELISVSVLNVASCHSTEEGGNITVAIAVALVVTVVVVVGATVRLWMVAVIGRVQKVAKWG